MRCARQAAPRQIVRRSHGRHAQVRADLHGDHIRRHQLPQADACIELILGKAAQVETKSRRPTSRIAADSAAQGTGEAYRTSAGTSRPLPSGAAAGFAYSHQEMDCIESSPPGSASSNTLLTRSTMDALRARSSRRRRRKACRALVFERDQIRRQARSLPGDSAASPDSLPEEPRRNVPVDSIL